MNGKILYKLSEKREDNSLEKRAQATDRKVNKYTWPVKSDNTQFIIKEMQLKLYLEDNCYLSSPGAENQTLSCGLTDRVIRIWDHKEGLLLLFSNEINPSVPFQGIYSTDTVHKDIQTWMFKATKLENPER